MFQRSILHSLTFLHCGVSVRILVSVLCSRREPCHIYHCVSIVWCMGQCGMKSSLKCDLSSRSYSCDSPAGFANDCCLKLNRTS